MPPPIWTGDVAVEPSLYAADFARLGEQIEVLLRGGVRVFHFDIGDGHFVDPVTIGPIVLKSIAPIVHEGRGFLDCHLMTEEPEKHFEAIREAGGDSVTVHIEACADLPAVVRAARELDLGAALALKPETDASDAARVALDAQVDMVLVMSIEPGYSGQEFMPGALGRIRTVRRILPRHIPIQVDGGVDLDTIGPAAEAGATLFVTGTAVFGAADIAQAYRALVEAVA